MKRDVWLAVTDITDRQNVTQLDADVSSHTTFWNEIHYFVSHPWAIIIHRYHITVIDTTLVRWVIQSHGLLYSNNEASSKIALY